MPARTQREYGPPYPFDAKIAGQGVMLERVGNSPAWREEKIQLFQDAVVVTAEDRTYQQFPPVVELPYAISDLSEGAGLVEQTRETRKRYHYGLFVDTSSGQTTKGPKFNPHNALPAAATQAIDFNGALYLACGRYLVKRTDDTAGGFTTVRDFGVGAVIGQMAVFQGSQTGAYLFVPLGSGAAYWAMNSAETFTQHPGAQTAEQFVVDHEGNLILATTESSIRVIRKSEDGGFAATWLAHTSVGDAAKATTWLLNVAQRLLVMKEDTIIAPTTEALVVDQEVAPDLRPMAAADNGKGAIAWDQTAVFKWGGGLWRYSPDTGQLQQFGPELLEQLEGEPKGQVAAVAGQAGICLWAGVNNANNGHAYLWRYGGVKVVSTDRGPERVFIPGWHGAQFKWPSKTILAMHTTSLVASLPRLYVFFSDGTWQWCKLARSGYPAGDPLYEFDTANTGQLYLPRYTAGFPFERKVLKAIGAYGRNLSSGARTIGLAYKLPTDGAYTSLGTVGVDPGERLQPDGSPSEAAFDILVELSTTSPSSSPILAAVVIYAALRTDNLKHIVATIKVGDDVRDRRGAPLRQSWRELRDAIESAITAAGAITAISPAGETLTVIGINFGHEFRGHDPQTEAPIWQETIQMVQTKSQLTRGTWERVSAYTWGDLATLTWGDVSVL